MFEVFTQKIAMTSELVERLTKVFETSGFEGTGFKPIHIPFIFKVARDFIAPLGPNYADYKITTSDLSRIINTKSTEPEDPDNPEMEVVLPAILFGERIQKNPDGTIVFPHFKEIIQFLQAAERIILNRGTGEDPLSMVNLDDNNTLEAKVKPVATQSTSESEWAAIQELQKDHVPPRMAHFIPTKISNILRKAFKLGNPFYTVYLCGPTGVGKTTDILQAAAMENRGVVRANITVETDESDLIGTWSLKNGNTVFEYGPVVKAMQTGSVLLLDELDMGSTRIMCLQPVLEGNSIFIKKTMEWVHPKPGFCIVATGNTKGKGSETGEYIGAQFLNSAFLDRFALFMDVSYPTKKEEASILIRYWESLGGTPNEAVVDALIAFATQTRKARDENAIDDCLSTRRLKDVVNFMVIFGTEVDPAVKNTIVRFPNETQEAFVRFWEISKPNLTDTTPADDSSTPGGKKTKKVK